MERNLFHSVTLDLDKCKGCTNCIKVCPTEAIRVRNGKAHIISERCIDCGECIRVCPHKAKKARHDSLDILNLFEYTVALPPPSLYAQYNNIHDQNLILDALLDVGFDAVFEVAYAAEIISEATREYLKSSDAVFPVISCACPAVTRLIRVRYPNLIKNLLPLYTPAELAAVMARREAMDKTGLPADKIGCIFLTPCPSKVTAAYAPIGLEKPVIDGAVSISETYSQLLKYMGAPRHTEQVSKTGRLGVGWAEIGGESAGLVTVDKYLSADGIENVIHVLNDLECEKYTDLEFVELNACPGGCVGGVLQVENPYIARTKLKTLNRELPEIQIDPSLVQIQEYAWQEKVEYMPIMELGENRDESLSRYFELQCLLDSLPGLDCGSCGAPTCETFAEDVVRGNAKREDCVVIMRQRMDKIINELAIRRPQFMELLEELVHDEYQTD
jgi:iron only hydrogenase large subunit-like protein